MKLFKKLFQRFIAKPVDLKIHKANFEHKLKTYKELAAAVGESRNESLKLMRRYGLAFAELIDPAVFARYSPKHARDVSVRVPFPNVIDYLNALSTMIVQISKEEPVLDEKWIVRDGYQDMIFDTWISQYQGRYVDVPTVVEKLREFVIDYFETISAIDEAEIGYFEAYRRRYDHAITDIFNITYAVIAVQHDIPAQ